MMSSHSRPTQTRWIIFALACAVSWLLYVHRYAWGVIKPALKQEMGLSDVDLGWLDSLFSVGYALGQVPGGMGGDRFGPRLMLTSMILFWSGAVACVAAGSGFWSLAPIRTWLGLAQAGAYPNVSQITRNWFPVSIRTTVQGAVASLAGRSGGACASIIVATLMMGTLGISWQSAFVTLGVLGLLIAVLFWLLFRNRPAMHPWVNESERQLIESEPTRSKDAQEKPRLVLDGPNIVTILAMIVYSSASTFADQLYVYWLPSFLIEAKGFTSVEMGYFAGLPLWGGAIGGMLGGVLNDVVIRRTGSRRMGRASVALLGKFLAAALIAASVLIGDGRLVMVMLLACKFFGDWSLASQWGATTDIGGPVAGTLFGIVNTAGSVASIAAGPIMGSLKQAYGWETLFLTVAAVYACSALCWLVIDSSRSLAR